MISKINSLNLVLCLTIFFYLNLISTNLSSEEIKILTYNTHGLPAVFARDDPEERFPLIGEKTKRYQLSLLQEDFAHHELLLKNLNEGSAALRGNTNNKSFCPFCSGSGLTIISNLEKEWQIEIQSEAFNTCSGWFGGLNDCFATKGFQLARIETPSSKHFYVVNTHLDAGRNSADRQARATQLQQIAAKIRQELSEEALIVVGDLNLRWNDPEDRALLETFKKDLGLTDSIKGVQTEGGWPILDYVLYRNGRETTFEVLEAGEDTVFQNKEGPLSDHPALFMKLLIY
jgi:hypothetical protein